MSGSVDEESLPAISHSEVFNTVSGGKRKLIQARVMEQGVSLGMVDPSTGRLVRGREREREGIIKSGE